MANKVEMSISMLDPSPVAFVPSTTLMLSAEREKEANKLKRILVATLKRNSLMRRAGSSRRPTETVA